MQQMKYKSIMLTGSILLGVATFIMAINTQAKSQEEQSGPKYEVLAQLDKQIELRLYAPRVVAQVEVTGNERNSLNEGFRILAGYIFGRNKKHDKLAMTAPVLAEPEKPPPEPVFTQSTLSDRMTMSFFMPAEYSLTQLPEPQDNRIKLKELPAQRFAAIRFSGSWNPGEFKRQATRLAICMQKNNLQIAGDPVNAYYNPPFTLPFLRRNEVLLPLSAQNANIRLSQSTGQNRE